MKWNVANDEGEEGEVIVMKYDWFILMKKANNQ